MPWPDFFAPSSCFDLLPGAGSAAAMASDCEAVMVPLLTSLASEALRPSVLLGRYSSNYALIASAWALVMVPAWTRARMPPRSVAATASA